ncbi:oxygen-independent coproporphyrinogen-III oxidase-like protein [Oxobacter pfennigii]|uniref:Oxygen-independent coproporphyrinogen-III oxidase-like protein n=1 Tax=Oxobacter pfennigii TaxID=36849 RepID=A0A0P8YFM3_9CLOT|nr:oxygen-independent coproporphyrinogen-III oxidase-like protein [Oxobacter pfennigii]
MEEERYNSYSGYLNKKYGCKVYKLPINVSCTCPNRDGSIGLGGCIFCGEKGAGFESLPNSLSVKEQLQKNMDYIRQKYKAEKFIAYFQNYSNTYMPLLNFKEYIKEACMEDVVEISVSTRPDCINDSYLEFLYDVSREKNKNISIELGLQTVNYHTLMKINRGHTLAEFLDGALRVKKYGFELCVHVILDFPWDNMDDVVECAKILSSIGVDHVKIHSLYIVKETALGDLYQNGEISPISMEEYINRVVTFLEYLSPDIVIQRLVGRVPEADSLFANWNTSWWKIKDYIEDKMNELNTFQGKKFNYLGGRALDKFRE